MKCTVIPTKIKQLVEIEVNGPPQYQLTLSEYEANALITILNKVGGSPTESPRGAIQNILTELTTNLVNRIVMPTKTGYRDCIYFEDEKDK